MTPERLAHIRESSILASLTPGDAVRREVYEEHRHAIEAAPDYLGETLDQQWLHITADTTAERKTS